MADTPERDQRTEEPTPHRLEEARRQGRVPFSREPAQALILLAALTWLVAVVPQVMPRFLADGSRLVWAAAQAGDATLPDIRELAHATLVAGGLLLLPLALLAVAAPILSALAQRSVVLAANKIAPDPARLDPIAGATRLVSAQNLVEFLKATLKVVVAVAVAGLLLRQDLPTLLASGAGSLAQSLSILGELLVRMLVAIAGIASIIAAIDVVWQHLAWRNSLKMTRQELKDELKSTEGHPEIKAKIRHIQRERARSRMLADVPKATVVITNPTHVAVALGYDGAKEPVPRVLAKGRDIIAAKIRERALAARVPIVSDPPVARALHATLDIGEVIRPEHYKAVASIISYVLQRRRGESARKDSPR